MRRIVPPLAFLAVLAIVPTCPAPIDDLDYLAIDFTNEKDAQAKAEWSIPDGGKISQDGLGCDKKVCSESWIQSKPLPIGLSWRPASGARITVKIIPPPIYVATVDGERRSFPTCQVFARYSPDCKHWSSWQALTLDEKETASAVFKGDMGVPSRERQKYEQYLHKYIDLDLYSSSGEEGTVRWILKREPNFFEHSLPFTGYIELLFESPRVDAWHIKRLEAQIAWGISGFGSPSNDTKTRWRFKAP